MAKLTRQELDHWLQELAARMRAEGQSALPGDVAEALSGEVEAIESSVAREDVDWLHDQVRDIAETLGAVERPFDHPPN